MKGEYEGKYSIVWDGCDIEMDLYASLDCEGDVDDTCDLNVFGYRDLV